MKTFIHASSVKRKKEKIDRVKVEEFIDEFNRSIKRDDYCINTGLDRFSPLNDNEFSYVVKLARKQGWQLTRFEDNNQSTSYQIDQLTN